MPAVNGHMTRREAIKQSGLTALALVLQPSLKAFKTDDPMPDNINFDVIIIGGSYAGLSAAMALGRSLRKVLIIDSGLPCNRQTPYSHNFITQDGEKPGAIAQKAKEQVLRYPTVTFLNGQAIRGEGWNNGFRITTFQGEQFDAKKLIFATGINDTMPDIKGFKECWGISVVHCPYCHGYEFRNKSTGIIANGARGFHLASMVHNLTKNLTLITNSKAEFTDEQSLRLKNNAVEVVETAITEIKHQNGAVSAVLFSDGTQRPFDALYAALPFTQHSDVPASLGCELTEQGHIKVNPFQETTVSGVFACGDNTNMMRSVANAVYAGSLTGAVVNGRLTEETF